MTQEKTYSKENSKVESTLGKNGEVLQRPCVTITQEKWNSCTEKNEWKINGKMCASLHEIIIKMGQ